MMGQHIQKLLLSHRCRTVPDDNTTTQSPMPSTPGVGVPQVRLLVGMALTPNGKGVCHCSQHMMPDGEGTRWQRTHPFGRGLQ